MATRFDSMTAQDIAQGYKSALDSVALIKSAKPSGWSDEDWADCVSRNKEHLRFMLAQPWWTTEDLNPLRDAVS